MDLHKESERLCWESRDREVIHFLTAVTSLPLELLGNTQSLRIHSSNQAPGHELFSRCTPGHQYQEGTFRLRFAFSDFQLYG